MIRVAALCTDTMGLRVRVDITSTLLWDTTLQDYIGILSVSDFIEALLHLHHSSTRSQLEAYKITEWRGT